jgi:septal ring factor EnvC (AmiA/AmiB activator)
MPEPIEITGKILFEIRDELKKTREELKGEIAQTNQGLDRVEQTLDDLRQDVKAIHGFLQRDLMALADRVARIERHLHLDEAA